MTQTEAWAHFAGKALEGIISGKEGAANPNWAANKAADYANEMLELYIAKHEELTNMPPRAT